MGLPNLANVFCFQLNVEIPLFKAFWQFLTFFWQTDRPTKGDIEAPILELKNQALLWYSNGQSELSLLDSLAVVTWLWLFPINVWNLLQLNLIWLTSCESSNIGGNWWSCMRSVIKAYRWEVWTSCWIKLTIQSSTEWEQFQEEFEDLSFIRSTWEDGKTSLWWLKSGTGDNARIEKRKL